MRSAARMRGIRDRTTGIALVLTGLLCLSTASGPMETGSVGGAAAAEIEGYSEPARAPEPGADAGDLSAWRAGVLGASYLALYGGAARVGSRFDPDERFEVVRLESAYAYDLVAHVWVVREIGSLFAAINRWAGMPDRRARRWGAWGAGFGALTAMELVNGFVPGVRFDPWDPVANAAGAWSASNGDAVVARHPWLRRVSLEFGYQDWGRVFGPERSSGFAGNLWHDYPNGRFGLGLGLGPVQREWARVFVSYEITSFDIDQLRNRFGLGIEVKPHEWARPWLEWLPGGAGLLGALRWWDDRLLLPGLYVQLWTVDLGPFSQREPFDE